MILVSLLVIGVAVVLLTARRKGMSAEGSMADSAAVADQAKPAVATPVGSTAADPLPLATAPMRLFAFDPNTADSTALLSLGLSRRQVAVIYNYRSKGGVFRKPSDFARIYGITVHQYKRLQPYISISKDYYTPASTLFAEQTADKPSVAAPSRKIGEGEHIDINANDTALLKRVPGIGSYFAAKIMRYGKRLGGYVSVDQLDEIEGFPEQSKPYFEIKEPKPLKLNVNKLSVQQLRNHPYLNYYQARAIVEHRRLHGPLASIADLAALPDFSELDIRRLEPYVEY